MAVSVYFKHGDHAEVGRATRVEGDVFPGTQNTPCIALKNDAGDTIARFVVEELVGYVIRAERQGEATRRE